jgi:hypothetical protein
MRDLGNFGAKGNVEIHGSTLAGRDHIANTANLAKNRKLRLGLGAAAVAIGIHDSNTYYPLALNKGGVFASVIGTAAGKRALFGGRSR